MFIILETLDMCSIKFLKTMKYFQDYDDFDTANELDELDKFFDVSNKSPPKELNGSNTKVINETMFYIFYTIT